MTNINFEPNEFVGYRIQPDAHSFNVVLVKRHGPLSKQAGQEYGTTMAYCRTLAAATQWIASHATRIAGARAQADIERATGSIAEAQALLATFDAAGAQALQAVAELQRRIDQLGLDRQDLVKTMRAAAVARVTGPANA